MLGVEINLSATHVVGCDQRGSSRLGKLGRAEVHQISVATHGLDLGRGFKRTRTPTIETVTAFPIKDGTLQMTISSLHSRVNT